MSNAHISNNESQLINRAAMVGFCKETAELLSKVLRERGYTGHVKVIGRNVVQGTTWAAFIDAPWVRPGYVVQFNTIESALAGCPKR